MADFSNLILPSVQVCKIIDEIQLKERIIQEVTTSPGNISLDSVLGMKDAKSELKKTLNLPFDFPGTPQAEKAATSVLLFGTPKVGKKTLVMAAVRDANYNLLYVRPETVGSPWHGDPVKILSIIFEHAKKNSPCVVLFKDFEKTFPKRSSNNGSLITNQMLFEMDEIREKRRQFRVVVIGTTERPWELDTAFLGRFLKLYAVLPDKQERKEILEIFLRDIPNTLSSQDVANMAKRTKNYSVSDLKRVVETAHRVNQIRCSLQASGAYNFAKTHGPFCKLRRWIKTL